MGSGSDGSWGGTEPVGGQLTGPGRAEEPALEHDGKAQTGGPMAVGGE